MLKQTLYNNALYDTYGSLLTPNQQEIYEYTFKEDLSLAEVAENKGISRSAVHDTLKKAQALLETYEAKLGFVHKEEQREELYKQLSTLEIPEVTKLVIQLRNIEEL